MKSSFHSLIPFLPLFCNCQFRRLDSIQFQAHIPACWRSKTRLFTYFLSCSMSKSRTKQKTASIVKEACLLMRCLAIDVLLFRALACAGVRLPSRCLAMGIYVTVFMFPDLFRSKERIFSNTITSKRRSIIIMHKSALSAVPGVRKCWCLHWHSSDLHATAIKNKKFIEEAAVNYFMVLHWTKKT
jgi:hypothetical protein